MEEVKGHSVEGWLEGCPRPKKMMRWQSSGRPHNRVCNTVNPTLTRSIPLSSKPQVPSGTSYKMSKLVMWCLPSIHQVGQNHL